MNNIKGFDEFNKINEEFHLEFDQHAANTMWDMFGILLKTEMQFKLNVNPQAF